MNTKIVATCAALAAVALVPNVASASCKGGFCVHGTDLNGLHVVEFSSSFTNVSHYNIEFPDSGQREFGTNQTKFDFVIRPHKTVQYSLQACSGGGFLQKSSCTPWVNFTHTFP